ncbi:hypothetical protein LQZ18_09905 [Lachnospiraceae bacterium ZAX-1]
MSLGLLGIIVALVAFLFLVYQGFNQFYSAALCALIVAFTNGLNPVAAFTETYVGGLTETVTALFSIIFLGVILGKVFTDTGAASSIATTLTNKFVLGKEGRTQIRVTLFVLTIIEGLCTMGGIDGYVLVFTMFPVCLILSKTADIPRRFIPCMLVLNTAFMAAPGAPQITNVMVQTALGMAGYHVAPTAAPIAGIVGGIIMLVGGFIMLDILIAKAKNKGEHFDMGEVPELPQNKDSKLPNFFVSIIPLIVVFVCYTVIGWNIAVALALGIVVNLVLMSQYISRETIRGPINGLTAIKNTLNMGANGYPNALITVSTPAALAAVIASTAAFGAVAEALGKVNINVYLLCFIVCAIIVTLTSSPPAAIMMSVPMVVAIATQRGIDFDVNAIARIAAFTSITFESLPWNGTVIMTQGMSHTTHKQSYFPIFLQTVGFTTAAAVVAALLAMVGIV